MESYRYIFNVSFFNLIWSQSMTRRSDLRSKWKKLQRNWIFAIKSIFELNVLIVNKMKMAKINACLAFFFLFQNQKKVSLIKNTFLFLVLFVLLYCFEKIQNGCLIISESLFISRRILKNVSNCRYNFCTQTRSNLIYFELIQSLKVGGRKVENIFKVLCVASKQK